MATTTTMRASRGRWFLARAMGLARVTTYAAFAFALLALAGARVLYADAREATGRLGETLARFSDVTGGAETVRVNGARIHVANALTTQPVAEVLDCVEAACRGDRETGVLDCLGTIRDGDERGGIAICFAEARGPFAERLATLLRTHDVASMGHLRYVAAERAADGRTRVRTVWTDGPVPLDAMFPANGDAPGSDSPVLPRPPSSRRVVVATADGAPHGVRIYRSTAAAADVRAFYDRAMADQGFTRAAGANKDGAAYVKDGRVVIVAAGEAEGATAVSLVD